jgi:C-terminal processing protease CtpA/Prc
MCMLIILQSRDGGRVDAVVIDMRNNGGGVLQGAVDTANLFMPPGNVLCAYQMTEGCVSYGP